MAKKQKEEKTRAVEVVYNKTLCDEEANCFFQDLSMRLDRALCEIEATRMDWRDFNSAAPLHEVRFSAEEFANIEAILEDPEEVVIGRIRLDLIEDSLNNLAQSKGRFIDMSLRFQVYIP